MACKPKHLSALELAHIDSGLLPSSASRYLGLGTIEVNLTASLSSSTVDHAV